MNCFELNRNIKKNIENRAEEDVVISGEDENDNSEILINDNYTYNTNFGEEENGSSQIKMKEIKKNTYK